MLQHGWLLAWLLGAAQPSGFFQFSAEKVAFLETQCPDHFSCLNSSNLSLTRQLFFVIIFGENIFEILTSVPGPPRCFWLQFQRLSLLKFLGNLVPVQTIYSEGRVTGLGEFSPVR
jgi:hypothetical protein